MNNVKDKNWNIIEMRLKNKQLKESTISFYKYLYEKHLQKIDIEDFNEIKTLLRSDLIPQSNKPQLKAILSEYYKEIERRDLLRRMRDLEVNFKANERDISFTKDEILKVIKKTKMPWKLLLKILWETGLRKRIIYNLVPDDFDVKNQKIKIGKNVPGNKGGVKFEVRLTKETNKLLENYININKTNAKTPIFDFLHKKKYPMQTINVMLIYYAKKAKIADSRHFTPHSIRHSFATHFINRGGSIEALSYMLGHKNIKTTERYAHKKSIIMENIHKKIFGD